MGAEERMCSMLKGRFEATAAAATEFARWWPRRPLPADDLFISGALLTVRLAVARDGCLVRKLPACELFRHCFRATCRLRLTG